jgi:hypothetical protein
VSDIDLELLASLVDDEGEDLMQRYDDDPELRRRYAEIVDLRERLVAEAERRKRVIGAALAGGPVPGEQSVPAWVAGQAGRPARRSLLWPTLAALAAGLALVLLARTWLAGVEPATDAEPVQVLDGGEGELRLLVPEGPLERYGELRWTAVPGGDVSYDLWIWEADAEGAALDELAVLHRERGLTEPHWSPASEEELPDSILVQVHATADGVPWGSSPRVWLSRRH